MTRTMATSAANYDDHGGRASNPLMPLCGPEWRERMLRKGERRVLLSPARRSAMGSAKASDAQSFLAHGIAHSPRQPPSFQSLPLRTPLLSHASRYARVGGSQSATAGLFRQYEQFPDTRFEIQRRWNPLVSVASASGSRRHRSGTDRHAASFVAYDRVERVHVLVTVIPKAMTSVRHVDHAHHLMLSLARAPGFQRLLAIYQDTAAYVFVQEFHSAWVPLQIYWEMQASFSEDRLRDVAFQAAVMVHFLHSHGLSAFSPLSVQQSLVVNEANQQVTALLSPSLILSGCILTEGVANRRERDIEAIGILLLRLCKLPHVKSFSVVNTAADLQLVFHEQIHVVSTACRAMIALCLLQRSTIDEVIKHRWLRHVDFVCVVPKLEHGTHNYTHPQRLLLRGLLSKVGSLLPRGWLNPLYSMGATPSVVSASVDDEEMESTRRTRKTAKRSYVGRRVLFSSQHGIGGGGGMLKRGIVIMPPLSSAMVSHDGDEGEDGAHGNGYDEMQHRIPIRSMRSFYNSNADREHDQQHAEEEYMHEISIQALHTTHHPGSFYHSFGYEFPSSSAIHEYDMFDNDLVADSVFLVEASAADVKIESRSTFTDASVDNEEQHRARTSSLLLDENGHSNTSIVSAADLQKDILRSLHQYPSSRKHNASDTSDADADRNGARTSRDQLHLWANESMDAVHLSAFGPRDISYRESFRIDIWAYLRQQRQEMLETALDVNESEVGQRVQPIEIARGTLITIVLESNDRFGVEGDECKSFRWRGGVNGVSFVLFRKNPTGMHPIGDIDEDEDSLCVARIVAGTKVSLLYIRLHASPSLRSSSSISPRATLSTRLEHVEAHVPTLSPTDLEIVRPIGKGAFGDAILAHWKEQHIQVVIKSPRGDAFHNAKTMEEFRHEAAVMQMLGKHPHVVELLGVMSSISSVPSSYGDAHANETMALVTEYLPNGSLDHLLGQQENSVEAGINGNHRDQPGASGIDSLLDSPLSLFSRTLMARDAAHGLVNIHQGHVLHRDIAARNCLLDENFRVKVCDFGLSRWSQSSVYFDDEHHGFGPIKWMAPESVLPPHLFSVHSDAYMFGVLMYEIFTGDTPFPGLSSREAVALILEGQHVAIPTHLPATHQSLMHKCFDVHPLARPTMDEIFTKLDQWILADTKQQTKEAPGLLWSV